MHVSYSEVSLYQPGSTG